MEGPEPCIKMLFLMKENVSLTDTLYPLMRTAVTHIKVLNVSKTKFPWCFLNLFLFQSSFVHDLVKRRFPLAAK